MAIIKQLKQFLTGLNIYPITKSNAVYDDTVGRLDTFMEKSITESEVLENENVLTGLVRNLKNPFTGNFIFPVTKTTAIYDAKGNRLDKVLNGLTVDRIVFDSPFSVEKDDIRRMGDLLVVSVELSGVNAENNVWTDVAVFSDVANAPKSGNLQLYASIDGSDNALEARLTTQGVVQVRRQLGLENVTVKIGGCGFISSVG